MVLKMKIRINKAIIIWTVIFGLMVFPYILPWYFSQHYIWGTIYSITFYVSIMLMMLYVVRNIKWIPKNIIWIVLIYVLLIYSTYVSAGNISNAVRIGIITVLLCMTISVVSKKHTEAYAFIVAVKYITLFFWLINWLMMVLYPNGMPGLPVTSTGVGYFLYGNVNSAIRYILPGMCCSCILDTKKGRVSIGTILFYAGLIYVALVVYFTATTMIGIVFIGCWLVFRESIMKNLKKNLLIFVCAIVLLEIFIVVLPNTDFIARITEFFDKDVTFTGRTFLWLSAVSAISKQPIWGYGIQSADVLTTQIGNAYGSHNYYLDYIYERGVVGFALLLCMLIFPFLKRKTTILKDEQYVCIGFSSALLIMFLMEPYSGFDATYMTILYTASMLSAYNKER